IESVKRVFLGGRRRHEVWPQRRMAFASTGTWPEMDFPPPIGFRPRRTSTGDERDGRMTIEARPQSLRLVADDNLRGVLALGLLEADGLVGEPLPPAFLAERDQVVERWLSAYGGRQPADVPGVAETRALFHALDIDPTKHRPSSEALLRRVLQGRGLPEVSPV